MTLFLYFTNFTKKIPLAHIFKHFVLSRVSHNTILLQILGTRMHGPSPTSYFGGPSSSSPLSYYFYGLISESVPNTQRINVSVGGQLGIY